MSWMKMPFLVKILQYKRPT